MVVFVPGLYGSVLQDALSRETVWVSVPKMLFGDYSVHLCHAFFSDPCLNLKSKGILKSVSIVPGIYSIDAYGSAIENLKKSIGSHANFSVFSYDWRQDLVLSAARLGRRVSALKKNYKEVDVVAHSMGGLILSYYLLCQQSTLDQCVPNIAKSEVKRAVIVGTPFSGAVTSFVNMLEGKSFGGNSTLMSAKSYGSFPSIFQLLPLGRSKILNEKLSPMDDVVSDPKAWAREGWGVFTAVSSLKSQDEATAFVSRSLSNSNEFFNILHRAPSSTQDRPKSPLLVVQGDAFRTLDKVVYLKSNSGNAELISSRKKWPKSLGGPPKILYADGDDTVVVESSAAPNALKAGMEVSNLTTKFRHSEMFKDKEVIEAIRRFLQLPN